MQNKPKAFSVFKRDLLTTTVSFENGGIRLSVPNASTPLVVLTPCINIRANNFMMLVRRGGCLAIYSAFTTDDCASIFTDKKNKAEFFDIIRNKTKDHLQILATTTKSISWNRVGRRVVAVMDTTEVMSYSLYDDMLDTTSTTYISIPYLGRTIVASSPFFNDDHNCELFAYALVGNAFAVLCNEKIIA